MTQAPLHAEVPAHDTLERFGKRHRHCIAIFVINEGDRLRRQLQKMKPYAEMVDIIVADGGSRDGSTTPERLDEGGVRTLLTKTGPGKLSAQMRMAMKYALDQGYDGLLTIDGNDKDDPAAIPSFIAALQRGVDHVQGSRFVPGGKAVRTPAARYLGVRLLHAPVVSLAAGHRYTDTTNGFRAYSRKLLLDPRVAPLRSVFSAYELHYYLAIRAARLGFRIEELPVTRAYPDAGPTPTKISGWRGNLLILQTLWQAARHRFDP